MTETETGSNNESQSDLPFWHDQEPSAAALMLAVGGSNNTKSFDSPNSTSSTLSSPPEDLSKHDNHSTNKATAFETPTLKDDENGDEKNYHEAGLDFQKNQFFQGISPLLNLSAASNILGLHLAPSNSTHNFPGSFISSLISAVNSNNDNQPKVDSNPSNGNDAAVMTGNDRGEAVSGSDEKQTSNGANCPSPAPSLSPSASLLSEAGVDVEIESTSSNEQQQHVAAGNALVVPSRKDMACGFLATASQHPAAFKMAPEYSSHINAATHGAEKQPIDCVVCGDKSSGKHYGQFTCEGCKSFFKRSVRRNLVYQCRGQQNCIIDQHHRNQCQFCRFTKCTRSGMKKEAVQRGRSSSSASFVAGSAAVLGNFLNSIAAHGQSPFQQQQQRQWIDSILGQHRQSQQFPPTANNQLPNLLAAGPANFEAKINGANLHHRPETAASQSSDGEKLPLFNTPLPLLAPAPSAPPPSAMQLLTHLFQAEQQVQAQYATISQPTATNLDNFHEVAVRLLVYAIAWAKHANTNFLAALLPTGDFGSLLKAAWSDLWILSASQWPWALSALTQFAKTIVSSTSPISTPNHNNRMSSSSVASLSPQLSPSPTSSVPLLQPDNNSNNNNANANISEQSNCNSRNVNEIVEQIQLICRQMEKIRALQLDAVEYACLKALALFNSTAVVGLSNVGLVEVLQEKIGCALEDYVRTKDQRQNMAPPTIGFPRPHATPGSRFSQLIIRTNGMRSTVKPTVLQQLFFSRLIGSNGIDTWIDEMIGAKHATPATSPVYPPAAGPSEPHAANNSNAVLFRNNNLQQPHISQQQHLNVEASAMHLLLPLVASLQSTNQCGNNNLNKRA